MNILKRLSIIFSIFLVVLVIVPVVIWANADTVKKTEEIDEPTEKIMIREIVSEEVISEEMVSEEAVSEEIIPVITWSTMHIREDVANIFEAPKGEKLGEINFTTKVKVSSEECEEGWAKIEYEGVECYIKSNNLLSAEEMLENYQYLFAQILYAEAGGVSKAEMGLVGEIVLNRLSTDYWEFAKYCTNLMGVIKQSGQYPETYRKIQNGLKPSEDAMEVAREMLVGDYERLLPEDCLWQTGFYPPWNVDVVRHPGAWELADGTVINVYHYYSMLKC